MAQLVHVDTALEELADAFHQTGNELMATKLFGLARYIRNAHDNARECVGNFTSHLTGGQTIGGGK
jgi:hypothetical protein